MDQRDGEGLVEAVRERYEQQRQRQSYNIEKMEEEERKRNSRSNSFYGSLRFRRKKDKVADSSAPAAPPVMTTEVGIGVRVAFV